MDIGGVMDNLDILRRIFSVINDKHSWCSLARTNMVCAVVASEHPDIREELTNPLWRLLARYPDANYNFQQLSSSRHITGKLLARFPHGWNYTCIAWENRISTQDIRRYPNLPWEWSYMHCINGLNIEFITEFADRPWDWHYLTCSGCISFKDILANPYPWDFSAIGQRRDTTTEDMIKYYTWETPDWHFAKRNDIDVSVLIPLDTEFSTRLTTRSAQTSEIYTRKDIFEIIRKFPAFPWDAQLLSTSKYLTLEIIEEFPINWDFSRVRI